MGVLNEKRCKCLANETDRHIININLNTHITKKQLENLFFNEEIQVHNQTTLRNDQFKIPFDKRVYVFEDIDCQNETLYQRTDITKNTTTNTNKQPEPNQSMNFQEPPKNTKNDKSDIDLSFLLNLFDGILETPGRIIIMTSNFYKKLDRALIRPGRIDIISEFEDCSHSTIIQMFEFFYSVKLTEEQKTKILSIPDRLITPAEMSKILFENFDSIEDGIEQLICVSRQIIESTKVVEVETKVEVEAPEIETKVEVEAPEIETKVEAQPSENKVDTPIVLTSKNELLYSLHNKNKNDNKHLFDMLPSDNILSNKYNFIDNFHQKHLGRDECNDYSEINNGNCSNNNFEPFSNSSAPLCSYT